MIRTLASLASGLWLVACGAGAGKADDCVTDEAFFADRVAPILEDCVVCHQAGGPAADTRHVLRPLDEPGAVAHAQGTWQALVDAGEGELLLRKPTGEAAHGGGERFDTLDPKYAVFSEMVARLEAPGGCAHPGAPIDCADDAPDPGPTPLRRLSDVQVRAAVRALTGVALPEGIFPVTPRNDQPRTFATNNAVSASGAESIQLAAEYVSERVDLAAIAGCAPIDAACARAALPELAARGYRRPLTEGEEALLLSLLDAGPEEGLRLGLEVILQSPQFLYLDRPADPAGSSGGAVAPLADWAIASQLSFFLTDGPPDAPLREAAAAGLLHTREQVRAQAVRLVEDPRAIDVVGRFHEDWLHLYLLETATRDPSRYPAWSPALAEDMRTESVLYATEVVWLGAGTYDALLFGRDTWVTPELAPLYGVAAGEGWQRTELDEARPGILTRAGFLTAHSYAATSSPVRRGAFVLEQLLCEDLVPPPGVNMDLPERGEGGNTIRDRLEQHWTDPACASCHTRIDPVGFAFEHFGALGEWRATWADGTPVDAAGALDHPPGTFDGAAQMLALLADSERARTCYARRWFEYALGRPADETDVCSLAPLGQRFVDGGGDLRSLLVDIAMSDAFRYRRREPAEDGGDP